VVGPRVRVMAVGQQALGRALDVGRIRVLEDRLGVRETERPAAHGPLLRDVLALHDLYSREGFGVSTVSQVALVLRCSEFRAGELLGTAVVLADLPGGFEALECGLLGVEQSAVVARQLQPLDGPARLQVWSRLQERLLADDTTGVQRTPARLRELLSGWVIEADPAAAVERRRAATQDGDVDYRRRDDGLVDLAAYGLTGPDAHACLARIRASAAPVGLGDDRPASAGSMCWSTCSWGATRCRCRPMTRTRRTTPPSRSGALRPGRGRRAVAGRARRCRAARS